MTLARPPARTAIASLFIFLSLAAAAERVHGEGGRGGRGTRGARHEPEAADVEMRLSARYAFAPASVRALVRVAPHSENRALQVAIESGAFYRSSEISLEGGGAPRSHYLYWRALPPGTYSVTATVIGTGGTRAQAVRILTILDPAGDGLPR